MSPQSSPSISLISHSIPFISFPIPSSTSPLQSQAVRPTLEKLLCELQSSFSPSVDSYNITVHYKHKVCCGKQVARSSSRDEELNNVSESEADAVQLTHETMVKKAQCDRIHLRCPLWSGSPHLSLACGEGCSPIYLW